MGTMPSVSRKPLSPSSSSTKRHADHDPTISPPPTKRKAQSSISKNAVASFFTPASQKPKERTIWTERAASHDVRETLLVAKYEPTGDEPQKQASKRKVAAFDLDSTLITTASGKKHGDDANDWKWWDHSVPGRLKDLYYREGYHIVIFSNQGGLTLHPDPNSKAPKNMAKDRVVNFKRKCSAVLSRLDIPLSLYAATGNDIFRKPRGGMWSEMYGDYDLVESSIDLENSIFVGDAGGRRAELKDGKPIPKDFSGSDRNFAHNIGIPFQTPEEFFLGEKPRDFSRDFDLASHPFTDEQDANVNSSLSKARFQRQNEKDIVLFCGPPGAGKSSFFWKQLEPLGYERVNQDQLKSKEKCLKAATEFLQEGDSVVIDNTNPDPDTRAQWVGLAEKHKIPIRCVWFKTPLSLCEHNDAVRSLNQKLNPESREGLPKLAFNSFTSRFKEPKVKEGFQDVVEVEFRFHGTKEEYAIWGRYWL